MPDMILKLIQSFHMPLFFVISGYLSIKDGVDGALVQTALRYIGGLIYSRGTWYWMPNCSPIWFLTAMFVCTLLFYFVLKFKTVYQCIFIVLAFAIVCVAGYAGLFKLPWNIDSALWGLLYMYIGYSLKQWDMPEKIRKQKLIGTISAFVLLALGIVAGFANDVAYVSIDSIIISVRKFDRVPSILIVIVVNFFAVFFSTGMYNTK